MSAIEQEPERADTPSLVRTCEASMNTHPILAAVATAARAGLVTHFQALLAI